MLLVALPLVASWILFTGPAPADVTRPPPALDEAPVPRRYAIAVAMAAAFACLPLLGTMSQARPLLIEKSLAAAVAAWVLGLASLLGAIGSGLLLDRFWAPAVVLALLTLAARGALLLAFGPDRFGPALLAVLLLGVTLGGD